jgi:hypothetical protein
MAIVEILPPTYKDLAKLHPPADGAVPPFKLLNRISEFVASYSP